MNINITVSNYRCFSETPVRFSLKKGLQSFVGINNSGKSCLLRLFYELRGIFAVLSDHQYIWRAMSNCLFKSLTCSFQNGFVHLLFCVF